MQENINFFLRRLSEKLWFKPLVFCLLSIAGALIAELADNTFITDIVPEIEKSSLEDLLATISGIMLVIAIFAVGSMLSAFSAASDSATPRSFKLVVSDDVSQNALSVYIGSFIFSIVAEIALKNGFYGKAGNFVLFILTIVVFSAVILIFLRWVERISKLGQLEHTIQKVEEATVEVLQKRMKEPLMGGIPVKKRINKGIPIFSNEIGYIQHINIGRLQELAEEADVLITLNCTPGTFVSPNKVLVYVVSKEEKSSDIEEEKEGKTPNIEEEKLNEAFVIEDNRSFYDDPRFGLIALSEIGSRALSPGINDPGTAIAIINSHVRLFVLWLEKGKKVYPEEIKYNRIEVPEIALEDIFDDAFRPIARDGANNIEVMLRLQKALTTIAYVGAVDVKEISLSHSLQAYQRAERVIDHKRDLDLLKENCLFTKS